MYDTSKKQKDLHRWYNQRAKEINKRIVAELAVIHAQEELESRTRAIIPVYGNALCLKEDGLNIFHIDQQRWR